MEFVLRLDLPFINLAYKLVAVGLKINLILIFNFRKLTIH